MDFHSIIKKIEELKKTLEQVTLSPIEKEIIKSKISEVYLLLFEKQTVIEPPKVETSPQKETPVEKKTADTLPTNTLISQQPEKQEVQPKKPLDVDYKSLVDTFLEKEPPKEPPKHAVLEDNSLLTKISQTKIVDLKRSIAMNDRFIFIKELFNSDFDSYNRYINDLNESQTSEQAEQYLAQLKEQYGWNAENETVRYFCSLVGRKFC